MKTLLDYTGYESGAIQYEDGSIWIGNWSSTNGVPRLLGDIQLGLADLEDEYGEMLTTETITPSIDIIDVMQTHEQNNGDVISPIDDFNAITIPDRKIIIVTNRNWN